MRKFKIIINAKDIRSRCTKCNKRAFVCLSRFIVKTMFYINAIEKDIDFLEIGQSELKLTLDELKQHSIVKELIQTNEKNYLHDNEEYTLTIHDNQIICKCNKYSVDLV